MTKLSIYVRWGFLLDHLYHLYILIPDNGKNLQFRIYPYRFQLVLKIYFPSAFENQILDIPLNQDRTNFLTDYQRLKFCKTIRILLSGCLIATMALI